MAIAPIAVESPKRASGLTRIGRSPNWEAPWGTSCCRLRRLMTGCCSRWSGCSWSSATAQNRCPVSGRRYLELIPEVLVVHFVVVEDFGVFDGGAELSRVAVANGLFVVEVLLFAVGAESFGHPVGGLEQADGVGDGAGQKAQARPLVVGGLGRIVFEACL